MGELVLLTFLLCWTQSDQMDDENGEGDLTLFCNQMGQPKDNHVMLISASSLTPPKSMACSLVFASCMYQFPLYAFNL